MLGLAIGIPARIGFGERFKAAGEDIDRSFTLDQNSKSLESWNEMNQNSLYREARAAFSR